MAVVYVTNGPWGNGTGAPIAPNDVDNNFYTLAQQIANLIANPPQANSITSIEVNGDQMTIHYTDSTSDIFTLPVATFYPMGEWTPITLYPKNAFVSNSGNLYIVKEAHTSAAAFDPDAPGTTGPLYVKVLAPPTQPNDYHIFLPGALTDGQLVIVSQAVRSWQLPANLAGSFFGAQQTSSANAVFTLNRNGVAIGTLTFTAGSNTPTIAFAALVTFFVGDTFSIGGPNPADTTLADISFDLLGTRI
jgi:hypothetical protein